MTLRIYTRNGDTGYTTIYGGQQLPKHHVRLQALGTLDELIALLGVFTAQATGAMQQTLEQLQEELFSFGSCLACVPAPPDCCSISALTVQRLEAEIDHLSNELPELTNFILPGGTSLGAGLHMARALARRWERCLSELASQESIPQNILAYSNRLSDYLFVLARYVNHLAGVNERIWKTR